MVVLEMVIANANVAEDDDVAVLTFDMVGAVAAAWTEPTLIFFTNVAPLAPSLY